jgi:putative spermidine/putrescine transport system ATP-binding protein
MQAEPRAASPGDASAPARSPDVRGTGLRRTYRDVVAIDDVDPEIEPREFSTMLGPSGSGKTTTLRLIAGFERPDAGRIELGGVDVTDLPPYALEMVRPAGYGARTPARLSGFQRQCVALARAIVNRPRVP